MWKPGPVKRGFVLEVVPPALRHVERPADGLVGVVEHRHDEQVTAEQEAVVDAPGDAVLGVVEAERAHHRPPVRGGLVGDLPEVGEERVAEPDPVTADAQRLVAERPGLAGSQPVRPHQRRQGTELRPPHVQGGGQLGTEEPADVVAPEPRCAHRVGQPATDRRLHPGDRRLGVATPLAGVALRTGPSTAAPDQRCPVGELADRVRDGTVVAQRVEVVGLVRRSAVEERDVVGQRLAEVGLEDGDAVVEELAVHLLPPAPGVRVGEVDERPHPPVGGRRLRRSTPGCRRSA